MNADMVRDCRLSNGSYNNLVISRAFRYFRAGFEANSGEKTNATPTKLERTMKSNDLKAQYTAVDMTTAAAQGFRDGVASVVVDLPAPDWSYENSGNLLAKDAVIAAIIAAGGSVKE